jgi:hypothetical protein
MSMLLWLVAALLIALIVWSQRRKKEGWGISSAQLQAQMESAGTTNNSIGPEQTQYIYQPYYNHPRNDLKTVQGQSIANCIDECTKMSDCAGFVTNQKDGHSDVHANTTCYLKKKMENQVGDGGAFSWIKKSAKGQKPAYSQQLNTTYFYDDYARLQGSKKFCQQKCDEMDLCNAFVSKANGECWLKSRANDGPRGEVNADTYIKEKFGPCPNNANIAKYDKHGWNCNITFPTQQEDGWVFWGRDITEIPKYQPSAAHCQDACQSTKHKNGEVCRAYSWRKSDKQCFLKYDVFTSWKDPDYTSNQGSHYGMCEGQPTIPKLDSQGSNCQWDTSHPLNDYTINGPNVHDGGIAFSNSSINNVNECARRCKSTKECKGFNTNNAYTRCWLKTRVDSITRQGDTRAYLVYPFGKCPENSNMPKFDANGSNCEDTFTELIGTDLGGMDIYGTYGDKENCKTLCHQRSDCKSYSWRKDGTCYLKNGVPNGSFNTNVDSGVRGNFGVCPDNKTMKKDANGINCFGKCPTTVGITQQVYKTTADDTCYGRCPNDSTKWKTNKDGTECFGKCTEGDTTLWKIDASGSNCFGKCTEGDETEWKLNAAGVNCFGKCTVGDTTAWKIDEEGTNCYGRCTNDPTKWKTDASGSECFGKCTVGDETFWKIDAAGSNCFGYCTEGNLTEWKLDASGSKCFGKCTVGNFSEWKIDEAGTNCFGYCTKGDKTQWKMDASGTNCFGPCENDSSLWKMDASGAGCYGLCPPNSRYKYKDSDGDFCFGKCAVGTVEEGNYKMSSTDNCGGVVSASGTMQDTADSDLEATLNEIEGDGSSGGSDGGSGGGSDGGSSGSTGGGSSGGTGGGSSGSTGGGSSGGTGGGSSGGTGGGSSGTGGGSSGGTGGGSSGTGGVSPPIGRSDDSKLPWDGTTIGSAGTSNPENPYAYNEPVEVVSNEPAACSGSAPYESKWYTVDPKPLRTGLRRGALQATYGS